MLSNYTAKYIKISSGYMGQLVEWPEVVTEGKTLEECREMLKDALREMIIAYREEGKEIPNGGALLEQVPVEFWVSVKRTDLIKYFSENGFYLLREGCKHSIYSNGSKIIPIKRHRIIDRITANELCKQAGLKPKF